MDTRALRLLRSFVLVALGASIATSAIGCAVTLPEPIYANQVEEYFPEPEPDAPDAAVAQQVRDEAETCALRLNGHRSTAETVGLLQTILSSITGITSTVGGVLSAIDFGNPDLTTAMGAMSAAGAGIGLVGNLIIGFVANPLEEQRLHTQAFRSWELAIELRYGGADSAAVLESLTRCSRDEAPPTRMVGSGVQFTLDATAPVPETAPSPETSPSSSSETSPSSSP